jgi:tRNA (guanine37-N1)-methyltransferase
MGVPLNQGKVRALSELKVLTLVCGHYEGIDHRVIETFIDEELSIGDYILTGGEIAAAVLVDAIAREMDDTLGNSQSKLEESFDATGLLEYEQYTRPAEYRGLKVPDVLLTGNHSQIELWRMRRRIINTLNRRPDLIERSRLSMEYRQLLQDIEEERHNEHGT